MIVTGFAVVGDSPALGWVVIGLARWRGDFFSLATVTALVKHLFGFCFLKLARCFFLRRIRVSATCRRAYISSVLLATLFTAYSYIGFPKTTNTFLAGHHVDAHALGVSGLLGKASSFPGFANHFRCFSLACWARSSCLLVAGRLEVAGMISPASPFAVRRRPTSPSGRSSAVPGWGAPGGCVHLSGIFNVGNGGGT